MNKSQIIDLYISQYGPTPSKEYTITARENYKQQWVVTLWFEPANREKMDIARQVVYDKSGSVVHEIDNLK